MTPPQLRSTRTRDRPGDQRHPRLGHMLDQGEVAPLGVGIVAVDVAAEDKPALVGLAEVEMPRAEGHHRVDEGLQPLRHEGLEHVALDRQAQARHLRHPAGVPRRGQGELAAADEAAAGLHAFDRAVGAAADAGYLAVLDDVDAAGVRRPGEAPGHRVVAHRAPGPVPQPPPDREARVVEVEEGQHLAHRRPVEQLRLHPVQPHGVAAPDVGVALRVGMQQVEDAPLRHHGVEVQLLLQPAPEVHGQLVERIVPRQQVVRPDDRGVAPDVARADPAFLQHRDVAHAEFLGEVEGGGEPVPAAADDHHVIAGPGLGRAPGGGPAAVAAQALEQDGKGGIAHLGASGDAPCLAPSAPAALHEWDGS